MRGPLDKLKNLFNTKSSQTINVQILSISREPSNMIKIEFITPEGYQSDALLEIGSGWKNSEFINFTDSIDSFNLNNINSLVGERASINLSEFPQFYALCKKPPQELVVSAANHKDVIEQTREFEKSKNPTMEELLYERIRLLHGISDKEARKMANTEALNMSELDALKISNDEIKEYNQ